MIEETIKKLDTLRDKYKNPESQVQIDADEKRLRELVVKENYANLDVTKLIVADAKKRVDEINTLLAYDESLNTPEKSEMRYAFFRTREVWEFIISRMSPGVVKNQIAEIEKTIDQELKR